MSVFQEVSGLLFFRALYYISGSLCLNPQPLHEYLHEVIVDWLVISKNPPVYGATLLLFGLGTEFERDWIVVGDEGNSKIAIQHPESQRIDSTEKDMVDNPFFSCVGIVGDLSKSIIRNVFI